MHNEHRVNPWSEVSSASESAPRKRPAPARTVPKRAEPNTTTAGSGPSRAKHLGDCREHAKVIDSRYRQLFPGTVRRRLKCLKCGRRWTTIEMPKDAIEETLSGVQRTVKNAMETLEQALKGLNQ